MTDGGITFLLLWFVLGGFVIIGMAIHNRQRMRELIMRERIAMIDKGLVPPPEVDPARFDRVDRFERLLALRRQVNIPPSAARYRSVGIMMIGFGLAFIVLLTFAGGVPGAGIGVGGAFMVIGAAMLVNGILLAQAGTPEPATPAADAPPPEPPSNIAP